MKHTIGTTIDLETPRIRGGNTSASAFSGNVRLPKHNSLLPKGFWTLQKIKGNLYTFEEKNNGNIIIEFDNEQEADDFITEAKS